jgi:hypothetical protein
VCYQHELGAAAAFEQDVGDGNHELWLLGVTSGVSDFVTITAVSVCDNGKYIPAHATGPCCMRAAHYSLLLVSPVGMRILLAISVKLKGGICAITAICNGNLLTNNKWESWFSISRKSI